jgi:hypothetical protein
MDLMKAATSKIVARVGIVGGVVGGLIYLLGRRHPQPSTLPELPAAFKGRRGPELPPEAIEKEPSRVATTRGSYR